MSSVTADNKDTQSTPVFETIPDGRLAIIPLKSTVDIGQKVNDYLVKWRSGRVKEGLVSGNNGYARNSYIIKADTPRFGSGEAKGQITESIRGDDLYLLVDVCNYSITYKVGGFSNSMSPDDHFQDLKRVISAAGRKAHRINVIMPYLYEGRQMKRSGRESLDCANALQELSELGVENIITFDAHDPRVMNAVPLAGFETVSPTYQFIKNILRCESDLIIDNGHMMAVSPDEGGMSRAIYLANVLGIDMGMFYKRRDYTTLIDGTNPIVAHEFLGTEVSGKDVIIIDDMISSGDAVLETAALLKRKNANRIFICSTFGIFTNGLSRFDDAYRRGLFNHLITTNLVYQSDELKSRPYYITCDMSKYIALIIDTLNHDASLSGLLNPVDRINKVLKKYASHQKI
ncbi:MAG TPA: ribose-phosphate pyrophosphokinase [Lachnospiraceae bacterium]|nr:ribose-phosphate pyrophosphokinase [Lachnospiraceae bacterium]